MAGPRTAFLHIGMPKTGTTAIQTACAAGRDMLAAHGLHFPEGIENHSEWLSLAFWDTPDARRLAGLRWHDGDRADRYIAAQRDRLTAEIARAPKHLLLSGEGLAVFRKNEVAALHACLSARFERVVAIAYLREPLDWACSATQQATKWSGDLLDDLFDQPRLPEYAQRFDPWTEVLGRESVVFRAFGGDIVADFSAALGLTVPLPAPGRLNEAVSHRTAMVLSEGNRLAPPFIEARHNPVRGFDFPKSAQLPGRRFTLPRETVETWRATLAAERGWANAALGRPQFVAPEPPALGRDAWMGGERTALDSFAAMLLEKTRLAQNERALRLYLMAVRNRQDAARAVALLDEAWLMATDGWTLDKIAREALKQDRDEREKFFAKIRLVRRIDAPADGDLPLAIGNPFDRPWRASAPSVVRAEPSCPSPNRGSGTERLPDGTAAEAAPSLV